MTSVVYFVRSATGKVKIGYTADFPTRMAGLRGMSPEVLELLVLVEGGRETEAYLHERFKAARSHGEWFEPTDDLLLFVDLLRSRGRQALPYLGDEGGAAAVERSMRQKLIIGEMARSIKYLGRAATSATDQTAIAARKTGLPVTVCERMRWKKLGRVPADISDAVRLAVASELTIEQWALEEEQRRLELVGSPSRSRAAGIVEQARRAGLVDDTTQEALKGLARPSGLEGGE